jgi:hypothetical protein
MLLKHKQDGVTFVPMIHKPKTATRKKSRKLSSPRHMKHQFKYFALLAGMAFSALGLVSTNAQSSIVTFSVDMGTNIANGTFVPGSDTISVRGTYNGWANTPVVLVQDTAPSSSGTIYTNTVDNTSDANGSVMEFVFINSNPAFSSSGGYEQLNSGYNRSAQLPATSGASLAPPTPFFGDAGAAVTNNVAFQVDMAEQINLGNFKPENGDQVVVQGIFNGWSGDAQVLAQNTSLFVTEQPSGVSTNQVWTNTFQVVGSPAGVQEYKYIIYSGGNNNYENPGPLNKDPNSGNRVFANVAQTLPLASFSDSPFSLLIASNITFSVDMTIVQLTDTNFNPASVTVNGDLMGWGGVAMTNNPAAANTNIYNCTQTFFYGVGLTVNYQYRYTLLNNPNSTVYDHANGANGGQGNRTYLVKNVPGTNVLSVFNDAVLDDYFLQPTPVFFSVDMNGAVTTAATGSHAFNSSADNVYINGTFANWYAWSGGANPAPAPAGYQMIEQGLSTIYTNTILCPPGPVVINYKYGIDIGAVNGGPADNEAASGSNHNRVLRSTGFNPYVMATDTFGNQYSEPVFNSANTAGGNLSVGAVSGGKVPVTWLGRPGAHLQVKTDMQSGTWQDLFATDGTNWTSGYASTNGFVSQTNWPASNKAFFRLVKP